MDTIRITLETLYDILRNEKKREDLQKLEETFFVDVVSYMKEKKALLDSKQESNDIFASGERDKLEYELRSIKRILKEIYERREKKIIDIALNKSKTGSDLIDTSALLHNEKEFYTYIITTLDMYRRGILGQLFKGEMPLIEDEKKTKEEPTKEQPATTFSQFEGKEETQQQEEPKKEEEQKNNIEMTKVKFIRPMPSFVWKDMKTYGPFDEGEEFKIFPEVAELLVRKGRAVII